MRISCLLLRWYKSFNINYLGYPDRRHQVKERPWTSLCSPSEVADKWKFIEIPIEDDITTIVGANESGKSHLLSAISKVINGYGLPNEANRVLPFDRVDLCHYASIRNKRAEAWPNLGLEFSEVSPDEWSKLENAIGGASLRNSRNAFTLVLTRQLSDANEPQSEKSSIEAVIYAGDRQTPTTLDATQLKKVRDTVLPVVKFIKSDAEMRSELPIDDLLCSLDASPSGKSADFFSFTTSQGAAKFLNSLSIPSDGKLTKELIAEIESAKANLSRRTQDDSQRDDEGDGRLSNVEPLEAQLFRVLGIPVEAISFLANLPPRNRSYADSLVATWNDEIQRTLNLSRFWQQDEHFSLRINFKRGVLFFELTDKTGYVYTFRERSSGLRYFLSYYIQAKALELSIKDRPAVILMDEPDSYLSITGQRSLMAVFESLAGFVGSERRVQLLYTTHSPFLINRNYPRRIRLVRKGDGEEGTQFIDYARVRRYEPVRSALGVDCAQTLFMGSANLLLEGPTDQYLLAELVRAFSRPDKIHDLLDLNVITLVSAESAPDVERVIRASKWADESFPATVVLFDDDDEGRKQKRRITGKANSGKERKENGGSCKELIKEQFVLLSTDLVARREGETGDKTIEDLVPQELWCEAVEQFLSEWCPDYTQTDRVSLVKLIRDDELMSRGLLETTREAFRKIRPDEPPQIDKMGLSQAVIRIVAKAQCLEGTKPEWLDELRTRIVKASQKIKEVVDSSRVEQRRETGQQSIKRLVKEFLFRNPKRAGLFDVESQLQRLGQEAESLGDDGVLLKGYLARLAKEVRDLRADDKDVFDDVSWKKWRTNLDTIEANPLNPDSNRPAPETDPVHVDSTTSE